MGVSNKRVIVKLLGDAKVQFLELERLVEDEKKRGVSSSFHQTLLASIHAKITRLKFQYDSGTHIPRSQIPPKYLQLYEVTNLWKIDLSGYWRLIYTLRTPPYRDTEVEIIAVWLDVLDIIDHPQYDKIFGYLKK